MKLNKYFQIAMVIAITAFTFQCNKKNASDSAGGNDKDREYYENMKKQVNGEPDSDFMQSSNVFDSGNYNPSQQSYDSLLIQISRVYEVDSTMVVKFDERTPEELDGKEPQDTVIINGETFIGDYHNVTKQDAENLQYNLNMAKYNKDNPNEDGTCQGKDCMVYTHVDKSAQKLYLYLNGQPLDTFDTSTARKPYTTPDFNTKPDGRMFKKYSSHTYPGGNYEGLGNMPYAVFISGGYAIHGATSGEIHELGTPASHGCIRVHPRNAKIYFNLVKYAGTENTWVEVTD